MQKLICKLPKHFANCELQSTNFLLFFLIGIHSMQSWTATIRHGVTRKKHTKRLKNTGNIFRRNLQLIGVC